MTIKYLTAESVCAGHPDKLCDLISDSILDACLTKDKASRMACEVLATKGRIIVAGEISCSEKLNLKDVVKSVLVDVGYKPTDFKISVYVQKQSTDIAQAVDTALEARQRIKEPYGTIGAGDQGTMYGYATNETKEMLPLPLVLSHKIVKRLDEVRKGKIIKGYFPDGKAQVTIEYKNNQPVRVKTIVVSVQHEAYKRQTEIERDIIENVLWQVFEDFPFDENTDILINPSGRFVVGGPTADTGLTGRKLMVDTYGGFTAHGGGAFSGRILPKLIEVVLIWQGILQSISCGVDYAEKCEVSISYAIGKANPVAFSINTFGTGNVSDSILEQAALAVFNLKPAAIIEYLQLRDVHYADTAVYGHFDSWLYPWEDVKRYKEFNQAVSKYDNRED